MKEYAIRQYNFMSGAEENRDLDIKINAMLKEGWELVNNTIVSETYNSLSYNNYSTDNRLIDAKDLTSSNTHYMVCTFVRTKAAKTLYGDRE